MKKLTILAALLLCQHAAAQEERTLDEVTVEAARVVNRVDGTTHYPTQQQKEHATQAYALLARLALPGIRIDETQRSVSTLNNRGGVQVRVNDIPATRDDLLSLDPKTVTAVDFIDTPGVRYGEGVAYVVNIHTRRAVSGYTIGADWTAALTTRMTDDEVFAKWNNGKSELALSYGLDAQRTTGGRYDETTRYQLSDSETETLTRRYDDAVSTDYTQRLGLTWSLADSSAYTLQTRLSTTWSRMPRYSYHTTVGAPQGSAVATTEQTQRSLLPTLDVYYYQRIGSHQSLTANIVGTYIQTRRHRYNDEGAPYAYDTHGHTYSLNSEAIYENQLRPFLLSVGAQYLQRYIDNEYTGDVDSRNHIHTSNAYFFGQLKGRTGRLNWSVGVGGSSVRFSEGANSYHFFLWRPKLSVQYRLDKGFGVKYDFEIGQHISQIANTSDVTLRTNSREWTVGNPSLRPNRATEHTLQLSYNRPRLTAMLTGFCRLNDQCNMAYTERFIDPSGQVQFLSGQRNQPSCDVFFSYLYSRWDAVPEHLSLTAYASVIHCRNIGDDYRHFYTAADYGFQAQAYLGRWSLSAVTHSQNSWMEGETRGHNGAMTALSAQYSYRRMTVGLRWSQPLQPRPTTIRNELMNRYVSRELTIREPWQGNLLTLNLTWSLSRGRKYQQIDRTLHLEDRETGISNSR